MIRIKLKIGIISIGLIAYAASSASVFACPPPPGCYVPDRYVLWASRNNTVFAQSENGDSVYLDYYGGVKDIKYSMVPQINWGGIWYFWADPDYDYTGSWGCGECRSRSVTFANSGGAEISRSTSTITVRYNLGPVQPFAGYLRATHQGWNCYKLGYGNYVISAFSTITMNVYLVKVDIKRNGTSIVDQNPTVSVGEKISLTGSVEPVGGNLTIDTQPWNIGGNPIKNFIATATEGRVVNLTQSDRENAAIDFYWYQGGEDVYVGYYADVDGYAFGNFTEFDVKRPISTIANISYPICLLLSGTEYYMSFGNPYSDPTRPGITYYITDSFSYNGASNGTFQSVQLIKTLRRKHVVGQNWLRLETPTYVLDSAYPYYTNIYASDSPKIKLTQTPSIDQVRVNDHFESWFMYKPNTDSSIPIPLNKFNWFWQGDADFNNSWNISNLSYSLSSNPTGSSTTQFPEWNGNIINYSYQSE